MESDLIYREDAKNFVRHAYHKGLNPVEYLDGVPAADGCPVVRGKWISDGAGYHWTYNCSICGWKDGYPFNERHNYCPNCGAVMNDSVPAADVVSREAFDRIFAENEDMREQLAKIGKRPGDSMTDIQMLKWF